MTSLFESYTRYTGVNDKNQEKSKSLGVFNGNFETETMYNGKKLGGTSCIRGNHKAITLNLH